MGDTMLMKNVQPPDDEISYQEQAVDIDLASFQEHPTYVMLLPTACAIKQQELPEYINLFNQRSYIDSVYTEMSGFGFGGGYLSEAPLGHGGVHLLPHHR